MSRPHSLNHIAAALAVLCITALLGSLLVAAAPAQAGESGETQQLATIQRSRRFDLTLDSFIDGGRPDANFGDASTMWVGFQDLMRPLVRAEIPICNDVHQCITPDAEVEAAYLYLYVVEGRGFANWNQSRIAEVSAHAVLSDWAENTASWQTPWTTPGGDIGPALDSTHLGNGKIGTWLRFDVTAHVADIIAGNAENNGFALTSSDPGWVKAPEAIRGVRYGLATQEYWDPSKIGYLRVMYRVPAYQTEVLVEGAPIHGTNGMYFGPDGNLYVGSVIGHEINVLDPETGEILRTFGDETDVVGADDLILDSDGNLYWGAWWTGEVVKLTPDGQRITLAQLPPGLNPITLSDDGRLFVAQCIQGNGVYEVDPEGVEAPRLILEEPQGAGIPCAVNGMDFGPDGYLYGPLMFLPGVLRIDVETGEFTLVLEDYFGTALKFDSQGRLHMVGSAGVLRIDMDTGVAEVLAQPPFALDNLAFDAEGRLFISDFANGNIAEVLPGGELRMVSPGGMILPAGVEVVDGPGGETLVVGDAFSVRSFDAATGAFMGDLYPTLFLHQSIASADDNLIASSWFILDNAVATWDPANGDETLVYLDFDLPLNAIDFQGDLAVAELGTGSVLLVDGADPSIRTPLVDGLEVPVGLAAAGGDLWVSDQATGDVWQIVDDGAPLDPPLAVAAGLDGPEGLAVLPDGNLAVVEAGAGRVSKIDLATGEVETLARNLVLGLHGVEGYPPSWWFNGVAVGPSGNIYVTGDIGNVIYRLTPR